jgi:hypothetical protein
MIRWIKMIFLFLAVQGALQAQDVFNLENSRKFAQYLYDSGQYALAADEFERVVFMAPRDSTSILTLLKAYRMDENYGIGLKRSMELLPASEKLEGDFLRELFIVRAYAGQHEMNREMLAENRVIDEKLKQQYMLSAMMLGKEWEEAEGYFNQNPNGNGPFKELGVMLEERSEMKNKSPFLAAGLSTVVPGLGKLYTGDWQDGLVALLFVGTNAWQSYRGFRNDGVSSVYGWLFGSISAGFWLGNIYGSFKAAKRHNDRIENVYYDEISGAVYSRL